MTDPHREEGDVWETEEVEVTKPAAAVVSVRLQASLAERVFEEAQRRGVPTSVVVRDAIEDYGRRHGERMTYGQLARLTGLARTTIESMAARPSYNTTLQALDRLCRALDCSPAELLEYRREPSASPNVISTFDGR